MDALENQTPRGYLPEGRNAHRGAVVFEISGGTDPARIPPTQRPPAMARSPGVSRSRDYSLNLCLES